jgi:hypothetical protein
MNSAHLNSYSRKLSSGKGDKGQGGKASSFFLEPFTLTLSP